MLAKCLLRFSLTAAAQAAAENGRVIAAVNRCATQNQSARSSFSAACGEKFGHAEGRARNRLNVFS
jgi:hypothetical protein